MAVFSVTYDLHDEKDYQTLWDAFDDVDSHKALRSFYLVSTNNTTKQIFDHFRQFIDNDDSLFVAKMPYKPIYVRALKGTTDWIKKHFS